MRFQIALVVSPSLAFGIDALAASPAALLGFEGALKELKRGCWNQI